MKTVILAGGLGTRLRGVLGGLPKSMAPIGMKPFLEYLLLHFKSQDFREFIISVGHGGSHIRDYFGDGRKYDLSIRYTVETELLGTAGALKLAEPLIDTDDCLIANGDTYFEVDLHRMLCFHKEQGAPATIALAYKEDASRYGSVVLNDDCRVASFAEKADNSKVGYINGGIYVFKKKVFAFIPDGRKCSLELEVLPLLVGKGLSGFPSKGYFIDIGIPEDYERAKKELPLRRLL